MRQIDLRNPKEIMTLSRLGSFHQSKLSFLRSFIREFKDWKFQRDLFELDKDGYGVAVYSVQKDSRSYSLVCFASELDSEERSDRVIATKWDAAFVLHDGIPTKEDIQRLKQNVPKQEVGRLSYKELTLSRANKSVRVFEHTVEALASGNQPDENVLKDVGYLYRTTAVYGSGKFGLADRYRIKERTEICGPFRLEMMLVYLVRQFTFDQVNHIAKLRNPSKAVELDNNIARSLGIGNSTGLGMAPFIINHPTLLHNWIYSREEALRQIRSIKKVDVEDFNKFKNCFLRSKINIQSWKTESEYQTDKIKKLCKDLIIFENQFLSELNFKEDYFWDDLYKWTEEKLSDEGIEYIVSMLMEPYDNIINPLVENMSSEEDLYFDIPGERLISDLINIIKDNYSNILSIDFSSEKEITNFWFISKNKEEPRLANRHEEEGSELEQPLAIARDISHLFKKLSESPAIQTVAEFLMQNNELRHAVRRCFIIEKFPYSEIQDNTIGSKLVPIDMLRLKLSFFGAQKFDPRSSRWLRINMYQGAPLIEELKNTNDTWIYNQL
ncbi:MAG: hypothetical protein ACKVKE_05450 [Candidatus Pelagibacterales bacterium]|jgi:hypothetical protein|tara:strand:+ start:789 stop:2450 length:1662 start_codon:yes stop_codon:yes gene_type:complete